jgi:predicted alpha/beta-fold hydrolase
MYSIGISLGSGILSHYMAATKEKSLIDAGMCIGCHFDTEKAMEFLK